MKISFRKLIIVPLIISVLIIITAGYCSGVITKNEAKKASLKNIDYIIAKFDSKENSCDYITSNIKQECEKKAQTVSIYLASNPALMREDMQMETLRVTSGASEILISNSYGVIQFSTTPSHEYSKINEAFSDWNPDNQYSGTTVYSYDRSSVFESAVSRRDGKKGLVILRFSSEALNEIMKFENIYSSVEEVENASHISAIIDMKTGIFSDHSILSLNNTACDIPMDRFSENGKKTFSYDLNGVSVLISYKQHNENIIIDMVPKKTLYKERTKIIFWMSLLLVITYLSFILKIRQYNLNLNNAEKKAKETE